MPIKIINIKKTDEPHIYCGRGSALGNPYLLTNEADRLRVIQRYEYWFYRQIQVEKNQAVMNQLDKIYNELMDKGSVTLGCYCAPKPCHCDVIKRFIELRIK